jgi:hypothetical protein
LAWFNQDSLVGEGFVPADVPLSVEGREFLLTPGGQSVMNIFTASGFGV